MSQAGLPSIRMVELHAAIEKLRPLGEKSCI